MVAHVRCFEAVFIYFSTKFSFFAPFISTLHCRFFVDIPKLEIVIPTFFSLFPVFVQPNAAKLFHLACILTYTNNLLFACFLQTNRHPLIVIEDLVDMSQNEHLQW